MDYEKKYKEALERARKIHNQTEFDYEKGMMEEIFPELKESEDEQSKKWILEYLYDGLRKSDEQFKGQFKAAIAWLEKQNNTDKVEIFTMEKPKIVRHNIRNLECYMDMVDEWSKPIEQKPVWNEEDEQANKKAIYNALKYLERRTLLGFFR